MQNNKYFFFTLLRKICTKTNPKEVDFCVQFGINLDFTYTCENYIVNPRHTYAEKLILRKD